MKNVLVLQHIAIEDPGYIKDLMEADGWNLIQIELDEGEAIPADMSGFDAMLCMGGPMDTWMEAQHPWLIEEKRRIHEWVVIMGKPFLGFCLGCQLLGEVLGGQVVESQPSEIGVLDVSMTSAAADDPLFHEYPQTIKALQWHSWEVSGLESNPDVTLLGSSDTTPYQIFRFRNNAYAMQFHIEVRADTVTQWGCVPEYKTALENSLGADALTEFDAAARAQMPELNRLAEQLYRNFKQIVPA
jgi:GMP synthase-like glutamine amidotransferase